MFLSTRRCNREFKLRDKLMKENPERLRGFVLFLAELFQQLEIQASVLVSFADPDPPDPHDFEPPGSGSIGQRYGSGSFYH
jgi:hypothetical protein